MTSPYTTRTDGSIIYATYMNALQLGLEYAGINVKASNYGAVGDGSTDDTTAINAAIAYANAVSNAALVGATVYFPPGKYSISSTLTTPSPNVVLKGTSYGSPSSGSTLYYPQNTGRLFDLGTSATSNVTFRDLYFLGSSASTATSNHCIYSASASMLHFERCSFNGFGGSAIRVDAGSGIQLFNVEAQNCLLSAVPSTYDALVSRQGVIELGCTEAMIEWCNINGVAGTLNANTGRYGHGYMIALYIKAGVSRITNSVFAFAQNGVVIESSQHHQVMNSRSEYNQGHGFVVECQQSGFVNNRAQDNSHDSDSAYSGFYNSGWSNSFIGNKIQHVSYTNTQKYGIDTTTAAGTGATLTNHFSDNHMLGNGTNPLYHFTNPTNTPLSIGGQDFRQVLADGATVTPDAQNGNQWTLTATASRTLAAPTNSYTGARATLSIKNSSGGAITTTINGAYKMAWTDPADGKTRTILLECYDGTNWKSIGTVSGDLTI